MKIYIGCAGWEYKDWIGPFYPKNINQHEHLQYYAKFFNYTEVNSPFYNLPSEEIIHKWANQVNDDFTYTVKVWKEITHDIHRVDLDYYVDLFFHQFEPLLPKVKNFLFQFPPWFKYSENNMNKLGHLLSLLPNDSDYVIEFRDNSWLKKEVLAKIKKINTSKMVYIATSYLEGIKTYYYKNQTTHYIRLIGDRRLKKFNRVQRTFDNQITDLLNKINEFRERGKIREIFIIVNNHYSGFAPETVIQLKKRLDLPFKDFNHQKSLLDFL